MKSFSISVILVFHISLIYVVKCQYEDALTSTSDDEYEYFEIVPLSGEDDLVRVARKDFRYVPYPGDNQVGGREMNNNNWSNEQNDWPENQWQTQSRSGKRDWPESSQPEKQRWPESPRPGNQQWPARPQNPTWPNQNPGRRPGFGRLPPRKNKFIYSTNPQSSPNCPDPVKGWPYVYFGEPGKCYLTGQRGPCPENMILFPQLSSTHGYCDCNCDAYKEPNSVFHSPRSYCRGKTDKNETRTLVHMRSWRSCQPLFESGFCPKGQWLVFDEDPKKPAICERSLCKPSRFGLTFFDYRSGKCRVLGAPCQFRRYRFSDIELGEYQISDKDWIPVCSDPPEFPDSPSFVRTFSVKGDDGARWADSFGAGQPQESSCPNGQLYSWLRGGCVDALTLDSDWN